MVVVVTAPTWLAASSLLARTSANGEHGLRFSGSCPVMFVSVRNGRPRSAVGLLESRFRRCLWSVVRRGLRPLNEHGIWAGGRETMRAKLRVASTVAPAGSQYDRANTKQECKVAFALLFILCCNTLIITTALTSITDMEHVRSFRGFPSLTDLQAFLAAASEDTTPFATSELYSSETNAKILDLELRRSRFRLFAQGKHREIFDIVDQTVQWLNESDQEYSYQLRRNDITEIRYARGDFFKKHKDYLSTTSNLVEEFTLILCVTPSERLAPVDKAGRGGDSGGETLIYPYASPEGVSFDTTTPGHGLLFRKDLEHAGNVLRAGEKHILTANLWATRQQNSSQVLLVTFPPSSLSSKEEEDLHVHHGGKQEENLLQQAANQETSYALPVDCLTGTMLEAHVRFFNQSYEQQEDQQDVLPLVVTYNCTNFTWEEFGTVAKILQRMYVHEECIRRHAECIEFFGPFPNENLLVDLSLDAQKNTTSSSKDEKVPAKKIKTTDNAHGANDLDVIVCENESRTQVVTEVALQLGFDSYVPFKMLFVEGTFETWGEGEEYSQSIPVTPVVLLLGDYNHVFAIQKLGGQRRIDTRTLEEFHTKGNYWDGPDPVGWHAGDGIFRRDQYEEIFNFYATGGGLSLKFALGEEDLRNKVIRYVFDHFDHPHGLSNATRCLLPLSHFSGTESDGNSESDGEEPDSDNDPESADGAKLLIPSLFHRDESGKVTFTWQEADAASSFVAAMNLDERVKACKCDVAATVLAHDKVVSAFSP